jgi:hypothetical protein
MPPPHRRKANMNKKLMLLGVGALTALAFTALTSAAAANETKLKCEGVGACTFNVIGSNFRLSTTSGDTIWCSSEEGNGEVTGLNAERESTTSNLQLLYTGCKEQNTIFHFACSNTATSGNITTNVMVMHGIALPGTPNEAGVLLTNAGETFTCAGGFASTQVTGSVIGEYETKCNTNTGTTQNLLFLASAHGFQQDRIYTGNFVDLEGKTSHTGSGNYETLALQDTTTLTFNQNVILTCA